MLTVYAAVVIGVLIVASVVIDRSHNPWGDDEMWDD